MRSQSSPYQIVGESKKKKGRESVSNEESNDDVIVEIMIAEV